MAGKKMWLGVLAIALVFGMMVIGCDNGSDSTGGGSNDGSLDGTWAKEGDDYPYLTYSGDNFTIKWDPQTYSGTVSYDGSNFEIKLSGETYTGTYTLEADILTVIEFNGLTDVKGWYKKQ